LLNTGQADDLDGAIGRMLLNNGDVAARADEPTRRKPHVPED
jgi:hypothetical protein